jgi:hypothetical protein
MKSSVFTAALILIAAAFFASCENPAGSSPAGITGRFVAVAGGSGETAWSEDGVTWESGGRLPADPAEGGGVEAVSWNAAAAGEGKCVAVARGGSGTIRAACSADGGASWTEAAMPSQQNWADIAYGGGNFVAIAESGSAAAYSADGVTWNAAALPHSGSWVSIAYGNGRFVAIDRDNNGAAVSADGGKTWTAGTLSDTSRQWYDIAWGSNGKFVALSNTTIMAYSADNGANWDEKTIAVTGGQCSVTYGGGVYAAVWGKTGDSNKAAWSTDGLTWTEVSLPESARWWGIAWGGGKFAAFTGKGLLALSADGKTWTAGELPELQDGAAWSGIAYMPGY